MRRTVITSNPGGGVSTGVGATVCGCTSRSNVSDGIRVSAACVVARNGRRNSGHVGNGARSHAPGSRTRIEAHTCPKSDRDAHFDARGKIFTRNSHTGNTLNRDVAASHSRL